MLINVMTWNTGITENLVDHIRCNKILDYADDFLQNKNTIVFLQQVVYKDPQNNWGEHEIYKRLKEKFKNYSIKYSSKANFMMTVAIASGNRLEELESDFLPKERPQNRSVAVEFNKVSFLGIHAENGSENAPFLKSLNGKADIILGDFNAGNYLESDNRTIFNQILKNHVCICNMPTKITERGRRTCIDHIFVKENMVANCSNLIVHEEINLSDHFPITFQIKKIPQ